MGRKPKPEIEKATTRNVVIRLTEAEFQRIEDARFAGRVRYLQEFGRDALLERAEKILEKNAKHA